MSTLIREAKYLRILTPRTTNGINPVFDEFGRQMYKESLARFASLKNWVTLNKRRPESLKYKVEIVENPDYIPKRRDQLAKKVRDKNPRPANERNLRNTQMIDMQEIEARMREKIEREFAEKMATASKQPVEKPAEHVMQYKPIEDITEIPAYDDGALPLPGIREQKPAEIDAERARKDARNERDRARKAQKKMSES